MKYLFSLLLLIATHCTLVFAKPPLTKKFITIADIHFNPFIGCDQLSSPCPIISELRTANPQSWDLIFQKYQDKIKTNYHQDTDYVLLQSTLTELQMLTQQQHPTFILILGDFLAHDFPAQFKKYSNDESVTDYQAFTKKMLQYVTYKLNQAAPTTTIYPVLGNNDSYNGNYKIDPNGLFLKDTATIFSALIKNNKNALIEFKDEYPNAGYYAVTLAQKNQRLIVLNSVLFSARHSSATQKNAAEKQLVWLQKQLNNAKQKRQPVLIALHIPFGIDVFLGTQMQSDLIRHFSHPLFLQSTYYKRIISLLQRYSDTVAAILPAHTHHDNFQLIATNTHKQYIPSILTPSISPIYGNNPGLKIFSYNDQTFELVNFDTYIYPLDKAKAIKWEKEYNFNNSYQPNCKQCSIVNGIINLKKDTLLIDSYKKYFGDSLSTPSSNVSILNYLCAIYNTDWISYKKCVAAIK